MQNPLPCDLFLEKNSDSDKNLLNFKGSITLSRVTDPFRKTWVPFYRELSIQITKQIIAITAKKVCQYFTFYVLGKGGDYDGEPYVEQIKFRTTSPLLIDIAPWMGQPLERISMRYRGKLHKLHQNGYAYGKLGVYNKIGESDSEDMWIRWKSNLAGYEYIEPDDELNLQSEDITFEICTEIPENLAQEFYAKSTQEIDCNKWIAFINDESHYPQKPKRKTAANNFSFEISSDCDYPDVCFTICLRNKLNDELEEKIEKAFWEFTEYYNIKHKNNIHDIINVKDIVNYPDRIDDEKTVQICVDFGNCNPKVINSLEKWLRSYDFGIEKIVAK